MSIFKSRIQIFTTNGLLQTVPAGATYAILPSGLGLVTPVRNLGSPMGGVFSAMQVFTATAQPASGSLVFTFVANNVNSNLVITVPAGSAPQTWFNLSDIATILGGEVFRTDILNNAAAASAQIGTFAFLFSF